MTPPRGSSDRGTALVAAVVLVLLLSAAGLGLALTSALEPAISRHFETNALVADVAESAVSLAAHELAGVPDWTAVLRGDWPSVSLEAVDDSTVIGGSGPAATAGVLTSRASCGHDTPCGDADTAAVTEERPWGANNPRFRLFGLLRGGALGDDPAFASYVAVVWVGDDPTEADGDPLTDGGAAPGLAGFTPGAGRLVLRAEAFGLQAHRTVIATVERGIGPPRIRAWIVQ